jgi:phage shock protein A
LKQKNIKTIFALSMDVGLREQLELVVRDLRQVRQTADALERENRALKASIFDLSLKYNQLAQRQMATAAARDAAVSAATAAEATATAALTAYRAAVTAAAVSSSSSSSSTCSSNIGTS